MNEDGESLLSENDSNINTSFDTPSTNSSSVEQPFRTSNSTNNAHRVISKKQKSSDWKENLSKFCGMSIRGECGALTTAFSYIRNMEDLSDESKVNAMKLLTSEWKATAFNTMNDSEKKIYLAMELNA